MAKRTRIADLKHRVQLCTAHDVVTEDNQLRIIKTSAMTVWASIEATRGSFYTPDGVTLDKDREKPSHDICIRYRPEILISSTAWLYEARIKAPARWFKVLEVRDGPDAGRTWKLRCRLMEASDLTKPEAAPATTDHVTFGAMPLPDGVNL
jgi:Phage head-tail joining protein